MNKTSRWIDWTGGDCPPHLQPEDPLEVCTWQGGRYYCPAKWVDWRGRKDDREGIVAFRRLVRVPPTPPTAAKVREDAFYNAGYNAGYDDDSPCNPDWGDGPSITPLDELMNEQADAKWAKPFRVAATATAWAFIDVREKDYAAYVEGHEAGFKDAWAERDAEDSEHAYHMWQKVG